MSDHITGQHFVFMLDALMVTTENFTLTISDDSDVKYNKGRPNGTLPGKVSGEGELELSADQILLITPIALAKGGWQELKGVDIRGMAAVGDSLQTVEAFGCMLQIKDLINAASNSNEAATSKIGFKVAGEDFISFNGVPYLKPSFL